MPRLVGLERVTAAAQLQKSFPRVGIQPLPAPYKPGRVKPADIGITDPGASLGFFVLGDVGGVKAPSPQNGVSFAMEQRQDEAAFVLVLGDVVYFNGEEAEYGPGDTSLAGFMANFCDGAPQVPAADPQLEFGRQTQTLPYCEVDA